VGVLMGLLVAQSAPRLLKPLGGVAIFPSPESVIGVLLGSVVVAMVFGAAPARRAANLDPAAALRRA
jgi:ABC-type antimicrobial peptide transport system permease subunit